MISIIIPVFNGEAYIEKNLNSLINQSNPNFEVVYINDGSTDNTQELLTDIVKTDSRFKCITIPNSGPLKARQQGLQHCKFDYITFVDIDDLINVEFIDYFLQKINSITADIYCTGFNRITEGKSFLHNNLLPGIFDNKKFVEMLCKRGGWELWGKVYKKTLFENIKYQDDIKIGEDALILFQVASRATIICVLNNHMYSYVHNTQSASNIKDYSKCRDGLKAALIIKKYLLKSLNIELSIVDAMVLLFFCNSLTRGFIKKNDSLFNQVLDSFNLNALRLIPFKKRLYIIFAITYIKVWN